MEILSTKNHICTQKYHIWFRWIAFCPNRKLDSMCVGILIEFSIWLLYRRCVAVVVFSPFLFLLKAINFHDNPKSCPNNVENPLDKPGENWKVGKINYIDTLSYRSGLAQWSFTQPNGVRRRFRHCEKPLNQYSPHKINEAKRNGSTNHGKVSGFSLGNPYVINEPKRKWNAMKLNGYKSSGYTINKVWPRIHIFDFLFCQAAAASIIYYKHIWCASDYISMH